MQLKKYVVSLLAVALSTAAFALPSPLPLPDQSNTNIMEEYLAQLQEQANAFNQVDVRLLRLLHLKASIFSEGISIILRQIHC